MSTAKTAAAPKVQPSAPRIPRSVAKRAPDYAQMRSAAYAMLRFKIKEDIIDTERAAPKALLAEYAQGETFVFKDGKVQVTRATKEKPLDTYDIEFDQDAWDELGDTEERRALQEQLLKLGVVRLNRSVKAAHPAQVKVFLAEDESS